jgi:antitoxin PrlF
MDDYAGVSTVTSQGQVTIPAKVRRRLGLHSGDTIVFVFDDDGNVRLRVPRFPSVASLRGVAGSLAEPLSWDQVRRMAHEDARSRDGGQ